MEKAKIKLNSTQVEVDVKVELGNIHAGLSCAKLTPD